VSVFFTKFQVRVRTRVVGRLGLGPGPYIVGRLGSGMRVSASFQLGYIALYRLVHGGGLVVAGGGCPTQCTKRGGVSGRGNAWEICPRGKQCPILSHSVYVLHLCAC